MIRKVRLPLLHSGMAIIFATCVAVQWNDPDAGIWMLVYGLACVTTAMAAIGAPVRTLAGLLCALCILWSLWLLPQVAGKISLASLFDSLQMKTLEVELGRELGGLLIILTWMTVILLSNQDKTLNDKGQDDG